MALVSRATIKSWFTTGLRPIQNNYHDWLDSFFHKDDTIAISNVTGLNAALSGLATTTQIDNLQAQIATGSWTPAISNVINCSFTSSQGYFSRIGNIVTMSGVIQVNATAAGTLQFNFTIPISSDFVSNRNCFGGVSGSSIGTFPSIGSDATTNLAVLGATSTGSGQVAFSFCAQYIIL
jgi:hypothetical protein